MPGPPQRNKSCRLITTDVYFISSLFIQRTISSLWEIKKWGYVWLQWAAAGLHWITSHLHVTSMILQPYWLIKITRVAILNNWLYEITLLSSFLLLAELSHVALPPEGLMQSAAPCVSIFNTISWVRCIIYAHLLLVPWVITHCMWTSTTS